MPPIDASTLQSLAETASASADYLDACDFGRHGCQLDPAYYRACGELLLNIFLLVDASRAFPDLLARSPAAREIAATVRSCREMLAGRPDSGAGAR